MYQALWNQPFGSAQRAAPEERRRARFKLQLFQLQLQLFPTLQ